MSVVLQLWLGLVCALPIVLLWAIVIALVSRFRWKVSQWFLPLFCGPFLFFFIVFVVDLLCGTPLQFNNVRAIWREILIPFSGSATPTTLVVVAVITNLLATSLLSYCGLWRYRDGVPRARHWSLRRVSIGLVCSLGLLAVTVLVQNWIVLGIARNTANAIAADNKRWKPPVDNTTDSKATHNARTILEEAANSKNPAFEIVYSPYQTVRNSPVLKEMEAGIELARVHVEVLEESLKLAPFQPDATDLLTWDRRELAGFRAFLNALRLIAINSIELGDHERLTRCLNCLALCCDQLRSIPDAECLQVSTDYAKTRSALIERLLFELPPTVSPDVIRQVKPLATVTFGSQREPMLRGLEAQLLYENAQMILGNKARTGRDSDLWIVQKASDDLGTPSMIVERVLYHADNQLLAPGIFESCRARFLERPDLLTGFGHGNSYLEMGARSTLIWKSFPTFATLNEAAINEDAREAVVKVGLQVAAFHKKTNSYPKSLAELVPDYLPEMPLDPFDNQPLRYLLDSGKGAIVYSVRLDRKDDQTKPPSQWGNRNEDDIIFCLGDSYRQRRIPKADDKTSRP